jgi:membrane associated rhomboid family serine protease
VAFFAHIGGFVFGMAIVWVFQLIMPQPPAEARNQMLYERAGRYRF